MKYGKETIFFNSDRNIETLDRDFNEPVLTSRDIFYKINSNPHYSEGIDEILQKASSVLIILPDITRKSGACFFLKELIDRIESYGKTFSFIFAVGTHRPLTVDEKREILTDEVYEKYSQHIINHDPDDTESMTYYGKTKHTTPVLLNNAYFDHDTIIPIASVSYHYFAGFGGARKMILPGIASRKSAMNNHKLALDERAKKRHPYACTGNLKQNPVHDDIVEAVMIARAGKNFFAINTILNENGEIVDVEGGDLFISHIKACERLKELTKVEVSDKYDIVICSCGGFPKDINMIQAQKSIDRVKSIVRDGGKIIFFAECKDGYGNETFENFFDYSSTSEMAEKLFDEYRINRQTAFNLRNITEHFDCYLYSRLDYEDCKRMGFRKINDTGKINELLKEGEKRAFVPNASLVYFENG
ncbi:nickel-dependent lactate racemase [Flexistipes sp.]|uniref:nickel-dependent lactate racemase n=1 Tax=Flexistipes sp. TaxID=3088135 RepID=UPI002E1B8D11|nr:nickel-dependent lactate racemase [Flexistipes sp.]